VAPDRVADWIATHGPMWALCWAALTGGEIPAGGLFAIATSVLATGGRENCVSGDDEAKLAELVTFFGGDVVSANVSFSAATIVATGVACHAWAPEAVVAALFPLKARGLEAPSHVEEGQEEDVDAEEGAQEAGERREDHATPRWGRRENQALKAWTYGVKRETPFAWNDPRYLAVAVAQQLPRPATSSAGVALADDIADGLFVRGNRLVHPVNGSWRLEGILALPMLLSPKELIPQLVPLLRVASPRVQLNAAQALYAAGLQHRGQEHPGWREAAVATNLDDELLDLVGFWAKGFVTHARERLAQELKRRRKDGDGRGPLQPLDGGGRYAMMEALRCIACFGSREVAVAAMKIMAVNPKAIGIEQDKLKLHDEGELQESATEGIPNIQPSQDEFAKCVSDPIDAPWRLRFLRYLERRWVCPITSPLSPF